MEWIFIIGLAVAAWRLWERVGVLEGQVAWLENLLARGTPPGAASEFEPGPEPEPEITAPPVVAAPAPQRSLTLVDSVRKVVAEVLPPQDEERTAERRGPRMPSFDFEDLFGRRLPIWAGGIALAAGGIFLVIYAIEQGLMGPVTRVALSFVFGLLLLAAAEAAHRFATRVDDPRVGQALAGAGLATLYAAFYLAGARYGLIGPAVAFAGLALVTASAVGLTFRYGLPTAVLGLVGGFATPMLVASEEANVPILAFYLALLSAGLALTAKRLGHGWLGVAALVGGFGWGGAILSGGPLASGDRVAVALYLLALGAAIPLIVGDRARLPLTRAIAGAVAAVQLGVLVHLAGYDMLTWSFYLLLAAALSGLSWAYPALRPGAMLAGAVGAFLLWMWPDPVAGRFVAVAAALGAVVLGTPLALVWKERGGWPEIAQASVGALAIGFAARWQFGSADNDVALPGLAAGLAALALVAGAAGWLAWRRQALARVLPLAVASCAVLAFGALHSVLPDWAEVTGAAAVTLALAGLVRLRQAPALAGIAWAGLAVTLATLLSTGEMLDELGRTVGDTPSFSVVHALLRWGVVAAVLTALALVEWRARWRRAAEALLGLVLYVLLAQVVPGDWLAWTAAVAAMAVAWSLRERDGLWGALVALVFLWALWPLGIWVSAGSEALAGQPMLASDVPDARLTLLQLMPLVASAALAAWLLESGARARLLALLAGSAALVAGHALFKQALHIDGPGEFLAYGMAERTVWQALLVGGGAGLANLAPRAPWRQVGIASASTGLAHFAVFSFAMHNALWWPQATGPAPLANWLLPSYAVAGAGLWWLARQAGESLRGRLTVLADALAMLLIAFWALSELRHAFSGSVLTAAPMTQAEDLLRSLMGIVLALGFLWWGSRTGQRRWRIGSLVLMLVAVTKVFLFDAAGLAGLLRAASFIALGASLIGISWVYARLLSTRGEATPAAQ
ncbi:DUF2339 domain-containing protein [Aurantiacibacter luteus]|uniref:DUF2339 domain-containing protein n=1 Tax=Aurantiacibacter luteus TaxID=1581420 RepID=UPI00069A382A|nr:DUF2339 domain-containing protein [Aurantiacibacter luteus]